jgi:hypothetical protein
LFLIGSGQANFLTSYNNHQKIKPFEAIEAQFWGQNGIAKLKNRHHFYFFFQIINYLLWPEPNFPEEKTDKILICDQGHSYN